MVALLNYREDGITPYFTFFKDGVKVEKLVRGLHPTNVRLTLCSKHRTGSFIVIQINALQIFFECLLPKDQRATELDV